MKEKGTLGCKMVDIIVKECLLSSLYNMPQGGGLVSCMEVNINFNEYFVQIVQKRCKIWLEELII